MRPTSDKLAARKRGRRPKDIEKEIAATRERLNSTLSELEKKMDYKHWTDTAVNTLLENIDTDTIKDSCSTAGHLVADTVKKHPWPALLVGAGATWLVAEQFRSRHENELYSGSQSDRHPTLDVMEEEVPVGKADLPSGIEGGGATERPYRAAAEKTRRMRERAHEAKEYAEREAREARDYAEELGYDLRDRAEDWGHRIADSADTAYHKTRDTVEENPWAVGLGVLAAGLLVGLAIPRVRSAEKHALNKARRAAVKGGARTVDRGADIAAAAVETARREAREQGLTKEQLKARGQTFGKEARESIQESLEEHGLTGKELQERTERIVAAAGEAARSEYERLMRNG